MSVPVVCESLASWPLAPHNTVTKADYHFGLGGLQVATNSDLATWLMPDYELLDSEWQAAGAKS